MNPITNSRLFGGMLELARAEGNRVTVSRLILVALLRERELSLEELHTRLINCLDKIPAPSAPGDFYFDLGFYEDEETSLQSLAELNWIKARNEKPNLRYSITPVGLGYLQMQQFFMERVLKTKLMDLLI